VLAVVERVVVTHLQQQAPQVQQIQAAVVAVVARVLATAV
jgi:hypothetical protein